MNPLSKSTGLQSTVDPFARKHVSECVHCITFHHNVKLSVTSRDEWRRSLETKNTVPLARSCNQYTLQKLLQQNPPPHHQASQNGLEHTFLQLILSIQISLGAKEADTKQTSFIACFFSNFFLDMQARMTCCSFGSSTTQETSWCRENSVSHQNTGQSTGFLQAFSPKFKMSIGARRLWTRAWKHVNSCVIGNVSVQFGFTRQN